MVIKQGEKVHVVVRRNFECDVRRHFAGVVREVGESVIRAEGYVSVFDVTKRCFVRRPGLRTQVISLVDAGNTITILPSAVEIEDLDYRARESGRMELTDGRSFQLDVFEPGPKAGT